MIEEILRLKVTNFTPLLVGWYEPNIVDPIGLRPTELKGIWRWWARAFACGVLYDRGCNPLPSDLVKIVGKDLGLGYAGVNIGGKSAMPSKYIIRVNETFEPTNFKKASINKTDLKELQRIVLLLGGRPESLEPNNAEKVILKRRGKGGVERTLELYLPQSRFYTISLFSTESDSNKKAAAVLSFLSAIMLMGIGKGGRRGLGSLDIIEIEKQPEINGKRINELSLKVEDLVDKTYEHFRNLDSIKDPQCTKKSIDKNLPNFPCLSKNHEDITSIYHVEARDESKKAFDVFKDLHNLFNLSMRSRERNFPKICSNLKEYDWFLGIPRKGKYKEEKEGGKSEEWRRPSPVILSAHDNKIFGNGAFLTVLASADWPDIMINGKQIDSQQIGDAKKTFENCLKAYCSTKYKITRIWPRRLK
ncbi:RAMP superfamily CRISPR-associated protein [Fervidicoccus fontis]|uniref:CRISPR-associated RAMP protein, Cmr1 family n=1 Tax=Fervidicoccus fontis (strain DSM 19380 / JCM 18336 / VKM B-2539 / Kam940) TaxID=1163730 RepID=H9ZZB3_FERFK|nr:RAMP superfamily CRISPR-associated protein [Fervidicoccus fontis]AFH42070.1 CRISPR-associated RAMP protein, Cmr1 family [Fervidicoccus fontis Kam940]